MSLYFRDFRTMSCVMSMLVAADAVVIATYVLWTSDNQLQSDRQLPIMSYGQLMVVVNRYSLQATV